MLTGVKSTEELYLMDSMGLYTIKNQCIKLKTCFRESISKQNDQFFLDSVDTYVKPQVFVVNNS